MKSMNFNPHLLKLQMAGLRKKGTVFSLAALMTFMPFFFINCGEPEGNPDQTQQNTIEVPINVPSTNLAPGRQVTIVYPSSIDATRRAAMNAKFEVAMGGLDIRAGLDSGFKTKTDAILARGLKITVEETNLVDYYCKVVDKQLVVETSWVEVAGVGGGHIGDSIIWMIDNGDLVAQAGRQSAKEAVHMAKAPVVDARLPVTTFS